MASRVAGSKYVGAGSFNAGQSGSYTSSTGTGIFNHEICLCLLSQLEARAVSWIEGILAKASEPNPETGASPSHEQVMQSFCMGLDMVSSWTPSTLKKEGEALTQNCPNIRDIYRSTVEIYVASYFQLYPDLSYEIDVPSLSVFVHCFYRFLARDASIRSMAIFQMFGDHRQSVFEGATRNALYHVSKRPMQEIFASLESMEKDAQKSDQANSASMRRQKAQPSDNAIAPPSLPTHPNHMFQQVVQNFVEDVTTPATKTKKSAKTPKSSAKKHKDQDSRREPESRRDQDSRRDQGSRKSRREPESRKAPESRREQDSRRSSRRNPDSIVPSSVPFLPSQRSASHMSASSHRTIALPEPDSKEPKSRKRSKRRGDDSLSSGSDTDITDSSSSDSDSDSGYSSEEPKRRHSSRKSVKGHRSSRRH